MSRFRPGRRQIDAWPGFVDVLSTLLLVIVFVLVVYVLAQFFLAQALSGKDRALDRLNLEIAELTDLLALEREENIQLRGSLDDLSLALRTSTGERDRLAADLRGADDAALALRRQLADAEARAEQRSGLLRLLEDNLGSAETRLAQSERSLAESRDLIVELRNTIDTLRADSRRLEGELTARDATIAENAASLAEVEQRLRIRLSQLARVEAALRAREAELRAEAGRADRLQIDLARRIARTAEVAAELSVAQAHLRDTREELESTREEVAEMEIRLTDREIDLAAAQERTTELEGLLVSERLALDEERGLSDTQRSQLDLLNQQMLVLRQEIARLNDVLDASEARDREAQAQIVDLGRRLNQALAAKVEELSRYRSEFFGRLREALGARADVQVVGDRFLLQSEILFDSGSAEIGPAGKAELQTLARTLLEIAETIPPDLHWILRVDGHTDSVPIRNELYRSNWALSVARALAVTDFLIEQGVPPSRLAATGFGEFQPLPDTRGAGSDPRNRRIEFKLTER